MSAAHEHHPANPVHDDQWEDADHTLVTDDEWHEHSGEAPPQHAHGQTTPGVIALYGLGGFIALLVSMAAVGVYFVQVNRAKFVRNVERIELGDETRELKARWQAQLHEYGWVDVENNIVRVPIENAIESVAREYAQAAGG